MSQPLLFLFLILLVTVLWKMASLPILTRWFQIFPLPLWCYLLPMVGTSLGWLPADAPLYNLLSQQLLPICLVLLLIGTDLKSLSRLGPMATFLMGAGALGTILGGLISFKLYGHRLPEGTWGGIGALSASWIGGSANLMAVKEALHVPDSIIGSLVIVDAVIAYSWMALLIWGSTLQDRWDRLITRPVPGISSASPPGWRGGGCPSQPVRQNPLADDNGPSRQPAPAGVHGGPGDPGGLALWLTSSIAGAILLSLTAQGIAHRLPTIGLVMNPASWTILLVTTITLGLSLTSLSRAEQAGVSRVGTFTLYILLASIGARGNFSAILQTPVFLMLGVTWIAIHGLTLLLAGVLAKAPLGLIAAASQANIGGTISAPLVGAAYDPRLASMGLLMAILGNLLGTYLGLLTATLAHLIS